MIEGETGLILRVPEAEPVVGRWRSVHDSSAPLGVPAHVTVLYPWVPMVKLTDEDRAAVASIAAAAEPIEVTFATVGRFPGVVWLDPQPSGPIRHLIAAVAARWPEYPPYGGGYGTDPIPHLTIVDGGEPADIGDMVADVERSLPLHARISELSLLVRRTDCWEFDDAFTFAG